VFMSGGRALKGLGGIPVYQPLSNSEYHSTERGSETAGISFVVKRETTLISS
jgi:hypothetical protein